MENGKRQYAVFGLGNFGASLALALQKSGCDVIAVDQEMTRVNLVKDAVSSAMRAHMEDVDFLHSLDLEHLDGIIIAAGDNLEATVMATMIAKEEGVPFVLAKVKGPLQADVLRKVGADEVIRSEYEMGQYVAQELMSSRFFEQAEFGGKTRVVERPVPKSWVGKSLRELDVRNQFGVTVTAIRRNEIVDMNPDPADPLQKKDVLVLAGSEKQIGQIR